MGVLFENSIVCHVFYAIVGWLVLGIFCGSGGWLSCFVLVLLAPFFCWGGLGLEFFSVLVVLACLLAGGSWSCWLGLLAGLWVG